MDIKSKLFKRVKGIPVFLIGILAVVGLATATVLNVYVTIGSDTANVTQSVMFMDGGSMTTQQNFSFSQVAGGSEVIDTYMLKNNGASDAKFLFNTSCDTGDAITPGNGYERELESDIVWSAQCEGITTRYVEYFDEAGHDFNSYVEPTSCDVFVDDSHSGAEDGSSANPYNTIQEGVDNAETGDVVCVRAGTYDEQVTINKDITLASKNGQGAANINGGVLIASDDVILSGFKIIPGTILGETSGVYLQEHDGVTIEFNEIDGSGVSGKQRLILLKYNGAYGDVYIQDNYLHDGETGITLNIASGTIEIIGNTISECTAGIGSLKNALVRYNEFKNNDEAIGTDSNTVGSGYEIKYNNFLGDEQVIKYGSWPDYSYSGTAIFAEDNWWGKDGIDVEGKVSASYMVKDDLTLSPNEKDKFGVINTFAINMAGGEYTLRSEISPDLT